MKSGKLLLLIAGLGIVIVLAALLIKLIGGVVSLVSGAFNALLGLFVILALALIVIWMFRYASKHK